MDIWELIRQNPWLPLVLGASLVSWLSGAMTKAARKADEEKRRQARRGTEPKPAKPAADAHRGTMRELAEAGQQRKLADAGQQRPLQTQSQAPLQPQAAPQQSRPQPQPQPETPEDLAAEIRRMMGLDDGSSPRPQQPRPRVVVAEPEPPPIVAHVEPSHGGDLAAELEAKALQREARSHSAIEDRGAELGASIRDRSFGDRYAHMAELDAHPTRHRATKARRLFDAKNPAAAIVAMEILGKPRALRSFEEARNDYSQL